MKVYRGVVQKGKKYGTALGFPTANIELRDEAVSGIYAARVIVRNFTYEAAVFADQERKVLEVHLLDFSENDFYDEIITVELYRKIRDTKRFSEVNDLRAAIKTDIANVRKFFGQQ